MTSTYNTKIPVGTSAPTAGTVNGSSAKGSKQGSISGKLGQAQPGNSSTQGGGSITGFGSGKPDGSTVNGASAAGGDQGSVSGKLAAQPASTSEQKVQGFTNGGIKAGKI